MSRLRAHRWAATAILSMTVALGACGSDDKEPAAQPSPDLSVFVPGDFDSIPVFRAATELQPASTKDGTTTASYASKTAAPSTVIDWYATQLPNDGWTVAQQPAETSEHVWRGDWIKDGRRLQVITSALPGDPTHTQLDLVLLPDTGDVPVGGTTTTT